MDGRYNVVLQKRIRFAGNLLKPGDVLHTTMLRVAAHLCRCGNGRPADETTQRDVALFHALDRVLP